MVSVTDSKIIHPLARMVYQNHFRDSVLRLPDPTRPARTGAALIGRRLLDVVDHQDPDRGFLRLQSKSKLLLECGED